MWTTDKIAAIRSLSEQTVAYVRQRAPKIYSYELVNLIFRLPYCRITDLVEAGLAKRQTASVYLQQLVDIGVLSATEVGRDKLFIHPKLMQRLSQEGNQFAPYAVAAKR